MLKPQQTNALNQAEQVWLGKALAGIGKPEEYQVVPLLAEASHRKFFRIICKNNISASYVLMLSPPHLEENERFETFSKIFAAHQINVPTILDANKKNGWYILTDLGETHLKDTYDTSTKEEAIGSAINMLIQIQAISDPKIPPYSIKRFEDELGIFKEWFVEKWLGETFPEKLFLTPFELLVKNASTQIQCCVHRDYHCRNILFSHDRIGLVDFQDALIGPISYDLASLLRDCYHRFSEQEIDHWISLYLKLCKFKVKFGKDEFKMQLDLTAVQRQLKAVGIFSRLYLRDGKSSHLEYINQVIAHASELCERHPSLQPITNLLLDWKLASNEKLMTKT